MMRAIPIELKEANKFVNLYHRHHKDLPGHRYSIGCIDGTGLVRGVCVIGRPVSFRLDTRFTVEVRRLCTDGYKNACSFLYSHAARSAKEKGYKEIISYILKSETGKSLLSAGWELINDDCGGLTWDSAARPRERESIIQKRKNYIESCCLIVTLKP